MDTHKNAPLTPKGREAMVRSLIEGGLTKAAAAVRFNNTGKTVAKWVGRFRAEGVDGLRDRSSRPLSMPSQIPPATCAAVEALRRQRHTGKQTGAEALPMPPGDAAVPLPDNRPAGGATSARPRSIPAEGRRAPLPGL
jgi:transposase IS481 family protein